MKERLSLDLEDYSLAAQKALVTKLRYESSTLILYKELSSTIFQSLSGIGNTCPDLHFVQYIKA